MYDSKEITGNNYYLYPNNHQDEKKWKSPVGQLEISTFHTSIFIG